LNEEIEPSEKKKTQPRDALLEFERLMREAGHPVQLKCVETPSNAEYTLYAMYELMGAPIYVQWLRSGGWRAYTTNPKSDGDEVAMIRDVIARCATADEAV